MHCKGTAFFCISKIFRQKFTLFLAFFLLFLGNNLFLHHFAISTLQNDRLNRCKGMLLYVLPYLCTFAPSKITFAAVFYNVVCARTLYIRKSLKRFYLMFDAVFRLICMFVLSFVFDMFAAVYLIRFSYLDYF